MAELGHIDYKPSNQAFDWNGLPTSAGVNNDGEAFECLGAFVNEQLIGSVIYQDTGDFLWIEHVFVLPQFRRKGIGETLMRKVQAAHPGKKLEGAWQSTEMEQLVSKLAEKRPRTDEAADANDNDDINRFLSDAGVIHGAPRPFEQVVRKIKSWPEFINANSSATVRYFNMGRFYNGFVPIPGSWEHRPRKPGLTGWEISVTYWVHELGAPMDYSITKGFTTSQNSIVMKEAEAKTVLTNEGVAFLNKEMDDFIRKLTPILYKPYRERKKDRAVESQDIDQFLVGAGVLRGKVLSAKELYKIVQGWPELIAWEEQPEDHMAFVKYFGETSKTASGEEFDTHHLCWFVDLFWPKKGVLSVVPHIRLDDQTFRLMWNPVGAGKLSENPAVPLEIWHSLEEFLQRLDKVAYQPYPVGNKQIESLSETVVSVLLDGDQSDDMLSKMGQKALDVPFVKARLAFVRALKLPGDEMRRFSPNKWMDSELHDRDAWFAVMEALGMERELYSDVRSLVTVLASAGANSVAWPWGEWDKLAERTLDYSWFEVLPPSVAQAIKSLFIARYRPPLDEK